MKISVWYHKDEQLPPESGWYLCFKDISMGDDYTDVEYYYYDLYLKGFYSSVNGTWENVIYWTNIAFVSGEKATNMTPAVKIVADAALKHIENFDIISRLSK